MPSSTLAQLRRALGAALNDVATYTLTAGTTSTITSAGWQDQTPNASEHAMDGAWLYFASGNALGNQRRARPGGLAPSTGVLTMHLGLGAAPAAGSEVDVTHLLPSVEQVTPDDTSYRTVINRALSRLVVPDRIELTITTAYTYSLALWPWLDRPERLVGIFEPGPTGGRAVDAGWRGFRLVPDAGALTLQVDAPFSAAGATLILEVRRPANTWINDAESAVGLVADADTVRLSTEDVLPAALAEAYRVLMHRSPGRPSGPWREQYETHVALARASRFYDTSLETEQAAPAAAPEAA